MYVNQAMLCVFESFIIRANICMFIAVKLSQIALFTYICSLGAIVKNQYHTTCPQCLQYPAMFSLTGFDGLRLNTFDFLQFVHKYDLPPFLTASLSAFILSLMCCGSDSCAFLSNVIHLILSIIFRLKKETTDT